MNLPRSGGFIFRSREVRLLNCLIAAPSQEVAAEWLGYSPTHLRRRLKDLRERCAVDTNAQLIVLAVASGAIDPAKVLPFTCPGGVDDAGPALGALGAGDSGQPA